MHRSDHAGENEQGRLARASEQARTALSRSREGIAAGASGVVDMTHRVADVTGDRMHRVTEIVREAEPDDDLRQTVADVTERSLHTAGAALNRAAPSIGRGAEFIADKAGSALHLAAGPLGRVLGAIAGTLGGWWKQASERPHDLPPADEKACQTHFAMMTVIPAEMSYDHARTGYTLGYVAGRNPDYAGRGFDEIEADLRTGFSSEGDGAYDRLREFARFGYERANR